MRSVKCFSRQDISAVQQDQRPEIRPEFWATPDVTSPDSCVPETLPGESQPHREWEEATVGNCNLKVKFNTRGLFFPRSVKYSLMICVSSTFKTTVAEDTLDSVSELSSFQAENTDYYSASPVGTVASSNDTVLDMEMSELMNLVSRDCSGKRSGGDFRRVFAQSQVAISLGSLF